MKCDFYQLGINSGFNYIYSIMDSDVIWVDVSRLNYIEFVHNVEIFFPIAKFATTSEFIANMYTILQKKSFIMKQSIFLIIKSQ